MSTNNPKVSAYVPKLIKERLTEFREERNISESQSVAIILAEYFGLNEILGRLPESRSSSGITIARMEILEESLANFAASVEPRLQQLGEQVREIRELLAASQMIPNKVTPETGQGNSLPNEPQVVQEPVQKADESTTGNEELTQIVTVDEIQASDSTSEPQSELSLEESENETDSRLEAINGFTVDEKEPISSIQPLSGVELSKRLKADRSVIARYKNGKRKQTLAEWSKQLDPEGVAWDYSEEQKKYIPVNQGEPILSLQGELLKANSSHSRQSE